MSRKRQLAEVRALEAKLSRSRQFQDWRNAQLPLASFIKTRAQPSIYYAPKRKHPQTDALLAQSAKELYGRFTMLNTIFRVYLCLSIFIQLFIFHISEEIEKREKVLVEELNLIEMQIGMGKHSQNFEGSSTLNTEIAVRSIEEGEENRDPNPENSVEAEINDNADTSMQSIINENFDNDHDHDAEKKEELHLDQIQPDENNG